MSGNVAPKKRRRVRDPERFARKLPTAQEQAEPLVYFFEAPSLGLFKIGHSAYLLNRLHAIQTASPVTLQLLRVTPGGRREELDWHRRFAHARTHGEWFTATDDLRAAIEGLPEGTPDALTCSRCRGILSGRGKYAICRVCWNAEWTASKTTKPPCVKCGGPRVGPENGHQTKTAMCAPCARQARAKPLCSCGRRKVVTMSDTQCLDCKAGRTTTNREKVETLGRQGYSVSDVATALGLPVSRVTRWMKGAGVTLRRGRRSKGAPALASS